MTDFKRNNGRVPCKYFVEKGICTNEKCTFFHARPNTITPQRETKQDCIFFLQGDCKKGSECKFNHPPVNQRKQETPKKEKKQEPCAFWGIGKCKKGEACEFQHPPRKPTLKDILEHESSKRFTPNTSDGITTYAPNYSGLPPLPPNGKCRVIPDEELVIYFIPFFRPINGVIYFKKIRLFRYNKTKKVYKLVFAYSRKDFHITTASASNGYLVCSRLPYDVNVLKMMEEAKKLRNQNEKLTQKLKYKDEATSKQIAKLKSKNRDLSDKVSRAKTSRLRETIRIETSITKVTTTMERLEFNIFDNFRTQDPVDLFIYDPSVKSHVHVLEYHKPADHVDLKGRTLKLWDKKSGLTHQFEIVLRTKDVADLDFDEPLEPKQLCAEF